MHYVYEAYISFRFYPPSKDISNIITMFKMASRHSKMDSENVSKFVKDIEEENDVYFVPSTTKTEDLKVEQNPYKEFDNIQDMEEVEEDDPTCDRQITSNGQSLLFVYQSPEMKRLYRLYAGHFIFLDATYKTCKYALPLFFLVVRTNVNYQVVGVIIVQHETKSMIKEALSVIKQWNPDVNPKYGMVDFSEEEIYALEETFPGLYFYKMSIIKQSTELNIL